MSVHLFPHQIEDAAWLARTKRAILAAAPGTGKTYTACAASVFPVLVVCPPYLMRNWEEAYREMYPDKSITLVQGTVGEKKWHLAHHGDVTLVSYNLMAMPDYMAPYYGDWNTVIYDEAHALRGRNSKRTKGAYRLRAEHVYMLTGTPAVKDIGDYYPLLRLCNSRQFSSYWAFVQEYCRTRVTPWATEIVGVRDVEYFQKAIAPYVRHRSLKDVFKDIPDAVWTRLPTVLTPKERKDHDTIKKEYRDPNGQPLSGAGAVIPTLRYLTAASKYKREALLDFLADHDEKVIVWVWYKETAKIVEDCIAPLKRPTFIATGDNDSKTRGYICDAFLSSDDGILIATIASIGEGQNLQGASVCVFYEMHYLSTANAQAIAREHRHGQTGTVRAYALVAQSSIDEAVYKVSRHRDRTNSNAQGINAVLAELMAGP